MAALCSNVFISRIVSSVRGGSSPSNGPSAWFWWTSGKGTLTQKPCSPCTLSLTMSSRNFASMIPLWHLFTYVVVGLVFTACIEEIQSYVGNLWIVLIWIWAGQSFFLDSLVVFRRLMGVTSNSFFQISLPAY